jgi:hypothetical protein
MNVGRQFYARLSVQVHAKILGGSDNVIYYIGYFYAVLDALSFLSFETVHFDLTASFIWLNSNYCRC